MCTPYEGTDAPEHSIPESRGFVPLREIYEQLWENRDSNYIAPVDTGFNDLDTLLGGMQRSSLLILGARPGMGKSALAANIAVNASRRGARVGIFSLEMHMQQLGLRLLASEAGVDVRRLSLGLYTDSEEQKLHNAINSLMDMAIYYDDTPFQTIMDMRRKAKRIALEHGLDLLVVDYLQLVKEQNSDEENRGQEISAICRSLKGMARELNIPILVCSQLSRSVEDRPGHRPILPDLLDSSSIENDADTVLFIYREDAYYTEDEWDLHFPGRPYPQGVAEIILAKNRHGPTGRVRLHFHENLLRFESWPQP